MNRAKFKRLYEADRPFSAVMDVGEQRRRRPSLRLVLLCAMILLVSGGIIGLSLSLPEKKTPMAGSVGVPAFGATGSASNLNPGIPNPTPWQYDPVTNQHWVPTPGHLHWHSGPPPVNAGAATTSTTVIQPGDTDILNPQPWQYDPVTNRHWNPLPGHQHWHSGTAPPPGQRQ